MLSNAHEPFKRSRLLATAAVNVVAGAGADHVDGMRGFRLLTSVILLASLASCAETDGPNYAYEPYVYGPYAYGPAFTYEVGPEAFYCCGFTRFQRFHGIQRFHHYGAFHARGGFHGGHHH
jgi:hypothetical protein